MPLLHSQPIHIGDSSFVHCDSLANLVIPKGSIFDPDAFYPFGGCTLFEDRFGKDSESIIAGLMSRFDDFPLHKRCYDHSSTTAQELLLLLIEDQGAMEASSLVDDFGMTPLHVFFSSTIDPRQDLLQVLLEKLPCCILDLKDANDKRPLDYLMANWTEENKILLQMTLQKWMLDPFDRWGIAS
ncbi:unnamed protein product [Cylindrotheca closterium]|uniref:Uncharacterized protein n=1 Tax=Cylindrotheca closterium TaxID=2856 RepID=A0AAD2JIS2_9STRA|nr:unnamed protein product [Cylindrotheca closterium]